MTRRLARTPAPSKPPPHTVIVQTIRDLLRADPAAPDIAATIHALNWAAGILAVAVATSDHTEAEYAALVRAKEEGWLAGVEAGTQILKGDKP